MPLINQLVLVQLFQALCFLSMNDLDYTFKVLEPEYPDAFVANPQLLVFDMESNIKKVSVYFMANGAAEISDAGVKHGMGKINLRCDAISQSGAYTASVTLRKVEYTFANAAGLAREFSFEIK